MINLRMVHTRDYHTFEPLELAQCLYTNCCFSCEKLDVVASNEKKNSCICLFVFVIDYFLKGNITMAGIGSTHLVFSILFKAEFPNSVPVIVNRHSNTKLRLTTKMAVTMGLHIYYNTFSVTK